MKLITNLTELTGTNYIEFLPGEYQKKCWNPESAFVDEEAFGFLEPTIARCDPDYTSFSIVSVQKGTWERILEELSEIQIVLAAAASASDFGARLGMHLIKTLYVHPADASDVGADLSTHLSETQITLAADFASHQACVLSLFGSFAAWIREQLNKHDTISILGL